MEKFTCNDCYNKYGGCDSCSKYYYFSENGKSCPRLKECNGSCRKGDCSFGHGTPVYIRGKLVYEEYKELKEPAKKVVQAPIVAPMVALGPAWKPKPAAVNAAIIVSYFTGLTKELEMYAFSAPALTFKSKPDKKFDISTIEGRVNAAAWIIENANGSVQELLDAIKPKSP